VTDRSEIPPTHTIKPIDPPPLSDNPTVEMLRADIDSGRAGDKNPVFDPALAPLGADDEAAGTPASPFRVALAQAQENFARWSRGTHAAGAPHHERDGFPVLYVSFIGVAAVVLLAGIWLARAG
jgi:hypothetical protein